MFFIKQTLPRYGRYKFPIIHTNNYYKQFGAYSFILFLLTFIYLFLQKWECLFHGHVSWTSFHILFWVVVLCGCPAAEPVSIWWTSGLFSLFAIINSSAVNMLVNISLYSWVREFLKGELQHRHEELKSCLDTASCLPEVCTFPSNVGASIFYISATTRYYQSIDISSSESRKTF